MAALRGPGQDQGPTVWSAAWKQGSSPEGKKENTVKSWLKLKQNKTNTTLNKTALRPLLKSPGWSSFSIFFFFS